MPENTPLDETTAILNITWSGHNGDLPDPIARDLPDAEILAAAEEALRTGYVPNIPADPNVDLSDFVIERLNGGQSILVRPKTPFGI